MHAPHNNDSHQRAKPEKHGPVINTHATVRQLGIGHRPAAVDKDNENKKEIVAKFVPYVVVHAHADSHINSENVADLINMERRFYLRPMDEHARASQATLVDASFDMPEDALPVFNDLNKAPKEGEGNVLELGTVVLQRIVAQMKGLHYEGAQDGKDNTYVKDAAKLSGLKPYGAFILGTPFIDTNQHF